MTQVSGSALHKVATAVSGNSGGAALALGSVVGVGASSSADRVLYYVDSSGEPAGGQLYTPASTDVAVVVTADSGPQEWIYVEADVAISRGEVVVRKDGVTTALGVLCDAAARDMDVLGVAQHEIAAGSFGFILRKGVGEVLGSFAANVALVCAASGQAAAGVEGTSDGGFARSLEADDGSTSLGLCFINARG